MHSGSAAVTHQQIKRVAGGVVTRGIDRTFDGVVLTSAELEWLAPACKRQQLAQSECLFREGTTPEAVYVVQQGVLAFCRELGGRRVTGALHRKGSIVADVPLLTGTPAAFDAVAIEPTTVLVLPAAKFFVAMRDVPTLASRWAVWSARRLKALEGRVVDLLAGDLRAQVASLLVHESDLQGSVTLTHQIIADLLGVQRTSVSRALRELSRLGVITSGYGHIAIRDRSALTAIGFGRIDLAEWGARSEAASA
jgi:CRP-like cAMP-binding protein